MRLQSPQYTGRSDFGSNGSSSIATPQSAHFKSRCRTSIILRSPKAIISPLRSPPVQHRLSKAESAQTNGTSIGAKREGLSRSLCVVSVPDRRDPAHGAANGCSVVTCLPVLRTQTGVLGGCSSRNRNYYTPQANILAPLGINRAAFSFGSARARMKAM